MLGTIAVLAGLALMLSLKQRAEITKICHKEALIKSNRGCGL